MVSSNQIHIVIDLVGVRYVVGVDRSSAELEPTGDVQNHGSFGIAERFDAHIGRRKELHARTANYCSIHR